MTAKSYEWPDILRSHILHTPIPALGAGVIDIYLVAYLTKNFGPDKERVFEAMKDMGISSARNSFQAIWQVGKGDGQYLRILDEKGMVKDWEFMDKWTGKK